MRLPLLISYSLSVISIVDPVEAFFTRNTTMVISLGNIRPDLAASVTVQRVGGSFNYSITRYDIADDPFGYKLPDGSLYKAVTINTLIPASSGVGVLPLLIDFVEYAFAVNFTYLDPASPIALFTYPSTFIQGVSCSFPFISYSQKAQMMWPSSSTTSPMCRVFPLTRAISPLASE